MPTTTALDIVTKALQDLGVYAPGDAIPPEDAQDCFDRLNEFVSDLANQRMSIFATARTTKALVAGIGSYTVGPGADIDIPFPQWIVYAGVILDRNAVPPTEMPIETLTVQGYAAIRIKQLANALPLAIYYDHNFQNGIGRIYLYPIPNVGNTDLVIYTPTQLSEFVDPTTSYDLPNGYARMLHYNLAVDIATMFGKEVSPSLQNRASTSLADIKRVNANQTQVVLRVDAALIRPARTWNWRTGGPLV